MPNPTYPPHQQMTLNMITEKINQTKIELLFEEYKKKLIAYKAKLNADLIQSDGEHHYEKGQTDLSELGKITSKKLSVVITALGQLGVADMLDWSVDDSVLIHSNTKNKYDAMEQCLKCLKDPENKAILSQRRDSWLVEMAKTVSDNIGLTWLYRALTGCEATTGLQHITMFNRAFNEASDAYQKLREDDPSTSNAFPLKS